MKYSTTIAFSILILLMLVGLWQKDCKAETVFLVDQYSYHWRSKEYYNDHHRLVGIEYNSIGIFNFVNSKYQHSTGVYKRTELASEGHWSLGWKGMGIYGYDNINLPIIPMVMLDLRVRYGYMGLEMNVVPGLLTSLGVLIHF